MKKYIVTMDCWISQQRHKKGAILTLTDRQARYLLQDGKIKLASEPEHAGKKSKK